MKNIMIGFIIATICHVGYTYFKDRFNEVGKYCQTSLGRSIVTPIKYNKDSKVYTVKVLQGRKRGQAVAVSSRNFIHCEKTQQEIIAWKKEVGYSTDIK